MTKKIKAFIVWDGDEQNVIEFASHAATARRNGANEMNISFEEVESCRRAPHFDDFADKGFVPAEVLVEHGWWFQCSGCYQHVTNDREGYTRDGTFYEMAPVWEDHGVWCTPECKALTEEKQRICEEIKAAAIEDFMHRVWERFPGVQIATEGNCKPYAYASEDRGVCALRHAVVSFHFPGEVIGPANYRYDSDSYGAPYGPCEPYYNCCSGDKEAFEAFASETAQRMQVAA